MTLHLLLLYNYFCDVELSVDGWFTTPLVKYCPLTHPVVPFDVFIFFHPFDALSITSTTVPFGSFVITE